MVWWHWDDGKLNKEMYTKPQVGDILFSRFAFPEGNVLLKSMKERKRDFL